MDVNIAMGNLLSIVRAETRAWQAGGQQGSVRVRVTLRARRVRAAAFKRGVRSRRLIATVTGPAGATVRVTLRRGHQVAARRKAKLGKRGSVRISFRARRGWYRAAARAAGGGPVARSQLVRLRLRAAS